MFVQREKCVEEHQRRLGDIAIYGQESNPTTWKLAQMNLAIRGIDVNLGEHNADTFHNDLHKGLKADYILANPPFNISDWDGEKLQEDARWKFGTPPTGNANYAWIQHMVSKLAASGTAGLVLANGSRSTSTTLEFEIRKNLIENDLIECIVTLPGQLFYSTQIPVCLWFVRNVKDVQKTNLVKAKKFTEMLNTPINKYNKRAIETFKVIEELIEQGAVKEVWLST